MDDLKKAESGIYEIKIAMARYENARVEIDEFRKAVKYLDNGSCEGVEASEIQPSTKEVGVIYSNRDNLLWSAKVEIPGDIIEDLIRKRHAELEKDFSEISAIIDVFSRALKS